MGKLAPDQRNHLYLLEAERTGIHKPLLAALYVVHGHPSLADGETGLGISPANRVSLDQVNTLAGQVQYAANTIRSLTDGLIADGLKGIDLWDLELGRYTEKFLRAVARGYVPSAIETNAARLEPSEFEALTAAYVSDAAADFQAETSPNQPPANWGYLDRALLALVERLPNFYVALPHQREALIEALRIWRKLDTRQVAVNALMLQLPANLKSESVDETYLDRPLLQFVQQVSRSYSGYPHQREALIRLTQLWRQLDSREAAIASLAQNTSPNTDLSYLDGVILALIQRIPQFYQGRGEQRNALVEGFRLWHGLESRVSALTELGVNPATLSATHPDPETMRNAAALVDRELLEFIRHLPATYAETNTQREALLRMVQIWRGLTSRDQALQSLRDDLQRMQQARRDAPELPPKPNLLALPRRPEHWTPQNIQLFAPILPNGSFTWAEATHGGTRMPTDQETIDGIVRIARLAQQARDRIGRPFHVTSWFRPPSINARVGGASNSRHLVGDAIDFYCDNLTGNQLYWALDPWWPGGLGRYANFPYLCHIDARNYRARWQH